MAHDLVFPSDAYVAMAEMGNCKVCNRHQDLRMGACWDCAPQVSGEKIAGGHRLWVTDNPAITWTVQTNGANILEESSQKGHDSDCSWGERMTPLGWQESRYKLWSLVEMANRFRVSSFATVVAQLRESATIMQFADPKLIESSKDLVTAALNDADAEFKNLPLSLVLRSQWRRLRERVRENAPTAEIVVLIRELNNNLLVELSSARFLMIPADRTFVYTQPNPIFGEDVQNAFPDASRDIAAAGRCYALDEWTACVVHTMRALEHGLRWLAEESGLDPTAVQGENWKNVIDQIEKKIRELESQPKSSEKKTKNQFLSEAATQFRWFKDAWRNDAAHAHVFYDERDGAAIFLHVSDFFRHIAKEAIKSKHEKEK